MRYECAEDIIGRLNVPIFWLKRLLVTCVGSVVFTIRLQVAHCWICRRYLVNTLFPQEIRMKITINKKQHVLCRPQHHIITTMSECPCNVLQVCPHNAGKKAWSVMVGISVAAVRSWTKVRTWTFLNRTQSPVQGSNFAWTEPGVRFWVQGCVEFAEPVQTAFEPEPLLYNSMYILCNFNYQLPHMVLIGQITYPSPFDEHHNNTFELIIIWLPSQTLGTQVFFHPVPNAYINLHFHRFWCILHSAVLSPTSTFVAVLLLHSTAIPEASNSLLYPVHLVCMHNNISFPATIFCTATD